MSVPSDTARDPRQIVDALAAVREALDIPHAATVGDDETRAKILDHRLGHAVAMLQSILDRDPIADIPWSAGLWEWPCD